MNSNPTLEEKLRKFCLAGHITPRTEKNQYLKLSYKGTDGLVSSKWNVKIYTTGSIVCNDGKLLQDILNDKLKAPDKQLTVLQIDDAGVGFPLLGVMIGVSDGKTIETDTVDVKYFQKGLFENKEYLKIFRDKGINIVYNIFMASPKTHRIEICSGFINSVLKNTLRDQGFDVRVTEIKGMLQDDLERLFKNYVKSTLKHDFAYDPKGMTKKGIADHYYRTVNWGKQHAPHLLKTGWKNL